MPGGGVRLKYSNPMAVDDVAAEFPGLTSSWRTRPFPAGGGSWPSPVHKPNVYIDLSGWSPEVLPEILVQYINTRLRDKMLFDPTSPSSRRIGGCLTSRSCLSATRSGPWCSRDNAARLLGLS
jgi:hypothetical protein